MLRRATTFERSIAVVTRGVMRFGTTQGGGVERVNTTGVIWASISRSSYIKILLAQAIMASYFQADKRSETNAMDAPAHAPYYLGFFLGYCTNSKLPRVAGTSASRKKV